MRCIGFPPHPGEFVIFSDLVELAMIARQEGLLQVRQIFLY